MIYGDGGRIFKPLAYGLDVVGHEFTHGVIDSTADLIYQGQSGALNESYADVFGALIDGGNWTMGEQVVKSPPFPTPYLRSLEDPNARRPVRPARPARRRRPAGAHARVRQPAAQPPRRQRRRACQQRHPEPGRLPASPRRSASEKMEQIYYRTLTQYLTPDADFLDAAQATVRAATDLYGAAEAEAVRNAFAQVGLDARRQLGAAAARPRPAPRQRTGDAAGLPGAAGRLHQPGRQWRLRERGRLDAGLDQSQRIIDPELPHTGARSAWLGGTDQEPVQYIYQDVDHAGQRHVERQAELLPADPRGDDGHRWAPSPATPASASLLANPAGDVIGASRRALVGAGRRYLARGAVRPVAARAARRSAWSSAPRTRAATSAASSWTTWRSSPAPPAPARPRRRPRSQTSSTSQGASSRTPTPGAASQGAQVFVLKPGVSASQAARRRSASPPTRC